MQGIFRIPEKLAHSPCLPIKTGTTAILRISSLMRISENDDDIETRHTYQIVRRSESRRVLTASLKCDMLLRDCTVSSLGNLNTIHDEAMIKAGYIVLYHHL